MELELPEDALKEDQIRAWVMGCVQAQDRAAAKALARRGKRSYDDTSDDKAGVETLRKLCKDRGIENFRKKRRPGLITLLEAWDDDNPGESGAAAAAASSKSTDERKGKKSGVAAAAASSKSTGERKGKKSAAAKPAAAGKRRAKQPAAVKKAKKAKQAKKLAAAKKAKRKPR